MEMQPYYLVSCIDQSAGKLILGNEGLMFHLIFHSVRKLAAILMAS